MKGSCFIGATGAGVLVLLCVLNQAIGQQENIDGNGYFFSEKIGDKTYTLNLKDWVSFVPKFETERDP